MKKTCMSLVLMAMIVCLSSYVQASGIEDLKISLKPLMNEYTANKVELSLKNSGSEAVQGEGRLNVPSQWGIKPAGFFKFDIAPGKSIKKSWTFANALKNPYNKYAVKVKISSGGNAVERQIIIKGAKSASINLGEPRSSKDIKSSIFGTMTHLNWVNWDYKEILPLVEKAGIKWIRAYESWGAIEREKGVMKIPARTDLWVNDALKRGINIQMELVFGNKHYPYKDFEAFKKGYANYCAFVVNHFKGRVQVWELWNEPHNFGFGKAYGGSWNAKEESEGKECAWLRKYTDTVIAGAKAIRKADPTAIIFTNCDNPQAYPFLDLLKAKKAVHLFDGISIHPYSYKMTPEVRPYGGKLKKRDGVVVADADHSFSSEVRVLREKMKSVGMNPKNLYNTEFGYQTMHRTKDALFEGITDSAQAKYIARQMILQLVNEIPLAMQYCFQDRGRGGQYGLIRHPKHNRVPKPSYYATQKVCSLFSSPVKLYKPEWQVKVNPDSHHGSKNWKRFDTYMIWDGEKLESLNRVEKYLFTSGDKELILVLWNAIRADGERKPLLTKNIILGTSEYSNPLAIDLMTGATYDIKSEVKGNKTFLKDVIVPDYPIVIKMFKK